MGEMKSNLLIWILLFSNNILPSVPFHVVTTTTTKRSFSGIHYLASSSNWNGATTTINKKVIVGEEIGCGSYGTVHKLTYDDDNTEKTTYIGKRPWNKDDLSEVKDPQERAARCLYYWEVENHCFSKLPPHPQLPSYVGVVDDQWMVFKFVGDDGKTTPAPTLSDLMKLDDSADDNNNNDNNNPQELKNIGKALRCESYHKTLDKSLESILTILSHIHENKVVHRDIKPSNLLVHDGMFLLMDFGSAADLEPTGLLSRRKGLENGNRVAISPIYSAPEVFIDIYRAPTAFDIFSTALLFCQLLFSYLDERTDAGFHQQLQDTDWDLNVWLSNELGSKLRPGGLDRSLEYLSERKGLWALLERMLSKDPEKRPSAKQALKKLHTILEGGYNDDDDDNEPDGPFFSMVIESMEICPIMPISRPLHYVATFSRKQSLGLVLSEMDEEEKNSEWAEATKFAQLGEVFVKDIVAGSQAEQLGIFEIGDQLQGIGELPFTGGGFEKAVDMLQDQPRNAKNVKLHFDRISVRSNNEAISTIPREIHVKDLGAWSSKGKRNYQEDAFVLHEIHDARNSVLIAGVMDGHGGDAASALVSAELPKLISNELVVKQRSLTEALEGSWRDVCDAYRQQCTDPDKCLADYDPQEGRLFANTGGDDLIAGTTISVMALDEKTGKLTVLNCGDSRSLVISTSDNNKGSVRFVTEDHTPQSEEQRLSEGIKAGMDYSLPECRVSRWCLAVGAYTYSLGRSLEGPFATMKGIVSDPDITQLSVDSGDILLSVSDGVWEVMDSNEIASHLYKMKIQQNMSASDAAQALCFMALKKGTSDNVSATVVFL